jgi:hypothetical protein
MPPTAGARLALLIALIAPAAAPALSSQSPRPAATPTAAAFDVMEKTIEELQRALTAREVTSRQLVDLYLARIEASARRDHVVSIALAKPWESRPGIPARS